MKKRIIFICVIILMFSLNFAVKAEKDYSQTVNDISPFVLKNNISETLNGFTETNEGWDSESILSNVTLGETIDTFPYKPLTDEGCLIVRTQDAKSLQRNYISKTFVTPLDLSAYNSAILSVNCTQLYEECKCFFIIEMYSNDDIFITSENIESGGWNGVVVDISEWKGRSSVNRIRISVGYESEKIPEAFFEYYIDSIALSSKTNLINRLLFSADGYSLTGGTGGVSNGVFEISANGDEFLLESDDFAYDTIEPANCIRVDFKTNGVCRRVSLQARGSEGTFAEESYYELSNSGYSTVYLPLKAEGIKEIRLCFEGSNLGIVQIYGIIPDSTYVSKAYGIGNVDTCAVNANTGEIIIKGSLNRESFQKYRGNDIYLFSNDLCDSITPEILSSGESIEKSVITSEDFIFRVKYSRTDDARLFLYKKYTVAVESGNGFEIVSSPKCITNPENYVKNASRPTGYSTGKGIYGESIAFMQEVGASDTVVWVDIGKFFLRDITAGSKFECGGKLYYYNSEYYSAVDIMIKNFAEKNIDVTLVFVISDTGNEALNRMLIHRDADLNARYCAYNTSDRQGLMYLRAISEFFARKYSVDYSVTRFVFGDNVAMSSVGYNMGNKTLEEFVFEYANGLRIVYNAVKSYAPYVEVYTYLDDSWNRKLPFDLYTRFDNKAFLDALNRCYLDSGNVEWGIVQNLYPEGRQNYSSYNDSTLSAQEPSDRVSFKNIGIVTDYLKNSQSMYNGFVRDYVIIEKTNYTNLPNQNITADYVYNCYKALNTAVSAYITDRNCNYNDAMKYIDTSLSLTASSFVSDVLGVATWDSIIDGFSDNNIAKKRITSGSFSLTKPATKGSIGFADFSSGTDGWKRYGFTEKMTAGSSMSGRDSLLSLYFGNVPEGETRGIVKEFDHSLDLSVTPILHFGINVASLPTNVNYVGLTVVITAGNDIYELTGRVKEATWLEIYCDFSSFSGINRVDSIKILFHAEENFYDSPQALITSIESMSSEYNSQQLNDIFNPVLSEDKWIETVKMYAYPVFITLSVLCMCVFIYRRTAKKNK